MIADTGSSAVEPIGATTGVTGLHLVHNRHLEALLFDRNLTDLPFRRACLSSSREFVRHIRDELDGADVAELIILSKGLVYQLAEAVAVEAGRNLPANLVSTSRVAVASDDATVEVSYARFDAGGSTLLVGDTVASGATIVAALREYQRFHAVRRLYVLSYAGALHGAARIAGYCADSGIECTILFGLAAFGLAENGFDLSFLHPATVTRDAYRERARRQFAGKQVSAVGWDFGSQAMAPGKYRQLCWVEADMWGLHGSPALAVARAPEDMAALAHEAPAYAGTPLHAAGNDVARSAEPTAGDRASSGDCAAVGVDDPGVR
ncbi:hypothetical protein GA0070606_0902 [Micromonospora citrea]|uniref:Uncharacterized protein n=1 Tax=Micromonospora citrea TaxID=47855 RepID=A0A1C6TWH0_9ACTN|nr:hypothetical protein [Micromonospora citrea]SCL46003.1 hypothetical protein GA0070606_0902 [Micromonospora citrea]